MFLCEPFAQACDLVQLPWVFRKAITVLDILEVRLASPVLLCYSVPPSLLWRNLQHLHAAKSSPVIQQCY